MDVLFLILLLIHNSSVSSQKTESILEKQREIDVLKNCGMPEAELFYNLTNQEDSYAICPNLKEKMRNLYRTSNGFQKYREYFESALSITYERYRAGNVTSKLRYEDYFALYYYTQIGHYELRRETHAARRIKNALYKLSIMQSISDEQSNFTLFYGESQLPNYYDRTFGSIPLKKEFSLNNFTSTSLNRSVAEYFVEEKKFYHRDDWTAIYEINIQKAILKIDLRNFSFFEKDDKIVLIPEMKFTVNDLIWNRRVYGLYKGTEPELIVKLTYDDGKQNLFSQQKHVMGKLGELQNSGTQFYVC